MKLVDKNFGAAPLTHDKLFGGPFMAGTLLVDRRGTIWRALTDSAGQQRWRPVTTKGGGRLLAGAARYVEVVAE